ncbi:MAG: hypothetical protein FWD00_04115, partial [Clostridiales bacterium]|nr:hypothetical protein [Clostridiales bacterium]
MFISRFRKTVSFLLFVTMSFSLMHHSSIHSIATEALPEEASASWDLRSFVQDVTIFDMDSDPQTPIDLENDLLYVENTYQFVLDFAETAEMQMAPNQDGLLLYQLPNQLDIQYVVPETAIYQAGTDIEIGRYTIDTTGLVTVWLDAFASDKRIIEPDEDVIESDDDAIEPDDSITEPDDDIIEPDDGVTDSNDNVTEPDNGSEPSNGNATESDDNAVQIDDSMAPLADSPYDYIRFSLEVVALLAEEGDGMLDFGNGMVAYIMPLVAALFMPLAAGDPWDLANFITIVAMYDLSQTPPVQVTPTDPTFIGNNYQFSISFAETPALQMEYDLSGVLTYQLPSALQITTAISQTPIRIANGAVVGWYTIDTTGLVTVWFDDVDQYGNPTPGTNYITLTDVTLTLDINAQLMDGAGNGLDFGNGIVVGITPPVLPPPSLTMSKTSRYDPNTERIYYIITITALGAPVSGIQLVDGPSITTSAGTTHNIINIPNAFYGFRYSLNGSTNFTPMNVNWISSATPAPTIFSYDFGDLVLNPNNFITVMYYLDLPIFIANNPQLVPSPLAYDFTVLNGAAVMGDGVPGVNDSTSDHVRKTFPISKSGTYVPPAIAGDPYQIEWTITIGDGHTTQINGGTVTDTLGANLFFQAPTAIDITLYDVVPTASFVGTADELSGFSINLANNVFTFTIPAVGDANPHGGTFGAIHEAVIVFYTDINIPPHAGQPPLIYENNLNFILGNTDVNTGGRVPFNPPTTNIISKTTSG